MNENFTRKGKLGLRFSKNFARIWTKFAKFAKICTLKGIYLLHSVKIVTITISIIFVIMLNYPTQV